MVTKEQVKAVWKCSAEGCNYTAVPTVEGYRKISGHQLAHTGLPKTKRGFQLVDESTGEILAQKLEEATTKGFIATESTAPASPPAPKAKPAPSEEPLSEVEPPETQTPASSPATETKPAPEPTPPETLPETKPSLELTTIRTAGIFTYEITLPADAFTLYNLAKALELETDGTKSFDEWVWDCITARFAKDYKKQLILAPVE